MGDTSVRVLVVDDVATMRKIISSLFHSIGYQDVETAESPDKAIEALEQKPFGLVVSDWHMEGKTGLELLSTIRGNPSLQNIPMILISAESSETNSHAARSAGADAYLVKPFSADVLKSTVSEVLELREAGQISYKGCVLMPQETQSEFRCHILRDGTLLAASTAHRTRHESIDEAKLWVDQTGNF